MQFCTVLKTLGRSKEVSTAACSPTYNLYSVASRENPNPFYLIAHILNVISSTIRHFNQPSIVTANQANLLLPKAAPE